MSWHEPGRDRDPWRDPDKGPPDLDEWFRRAWRRLRALFGRSQPPRGGGVLRLWWVVPVILIGIWLLTGFYRVPDSHQAVLQRFGAYAGSTRAGLHWYWPWPIGTHSLVARGTDRSISQHARVLTRDGQLVSLRLTVAYQIGNPRKYLFGSVNPIGLIGALADAGLARAARQMDLQTLRSGDMSAIEEQEKKRIDSALQTAGTGITVQSVNIGHVELPEQVRARRKELASVRDDNAKQAGKAKSQSSESVLEAGRKASAMIAAAQQAARKREARAKVRLAQFKALLPAWRKAPSSTRQMLRADVLSGVLAKLPKVVVSGSVHSVTIPPVAASASKAASASSASSPAQTTMRKGSKKQ